MGRALPRARGLKLMVGTPMGFSASRALPRARGLKRGRDGRTGHARGRALPRARGLKLLQDLGRKAALVSRPPTGAWIETSICRRVSSERPSRPPTGAWIEPVVGLPPAIQTDRRALPRARGLKHFRAHPPDQRLASRPPTGAWIETAFPRAARPAGLSRPPTGAWIETTGLSTGSRPDGCRALPRARGLKPGGVAGDERGAGGRALPRARGLKQDEINREAGHRGSRPPTGAWIETTQSRPLH